MKNENESTAMALTIEKCREIVGCPAGVDLQDHLRQLAAENVAARNAVQVFCDVVGANTDAICEEVGPEGVRAILAAMSATGNMVVTDSIYAGIKADGVEEFAAYCGEENSVFVEAKANYRSLPDAAYEFAQQLREGAK